MFSCSSLSQSGPRTQACVSRQPYPYTGNCSRKPRKVSSVRLDSRPNKNLSLEYKTMVSCFNGNKGIYLIFSAWLRKWWTEKPWCYQISYYLATLVTRLKTLPPKATGSTSVIRLVNFTSKLGLLFLEPKSEISLSVIFQICRSVKKQGL